MLKDPIGKSKSAMTEYNLPSGAAVQNTKLQVYIISINEFLKLNEITIFPRFVHLDGGNGQLYD